MSSRTRPAGRPTLDQVAARAGVGRGTVSRVVNGSPQVSAEARAAVEKAIAELGYVPNRAARALVTQRTESVALAVSEPEGRLFGEQFLAGVVRGISAVLGETPLHLSLAWASSPAELVRVGQQLTDQHVDGVLLLSLHDADLLAAGLEERGLPTVLGGRPLSAAGRACFVDVDNAGGAGMAVEHLAGTGRRRVATIAGPLDLGAGVDRLAGYRDAGRRAGLPADDRLIAHGDFSEESGVEAMRTLLDRVPDLDAVFAASDLMAAGALRVLRERGRRVPDDVAVVGFDDSAVARHTEPPLTSVRQPVVEMGRQMARLLLARIAGEADALSQVVLDTHLVLRGSA